jgi:peptidyl-prolyl cis-trans isomerase A (cyclophilin A)
MAKLGGDPDNATSQWFINLSDNLNLDTDNGGYTVFGQVIDNGMTVVDSIASLDKFDFGGALQTAPLLNFPGTEISEGNFVIVSSVEILDGPPRQ